AVNPGRGLLHPEDPPAPRAGVYRHLLAANLRGEKAPIALAAVAALAFATRPTRAAVVAGLRPGPTVLRLGGERGPPRRARARQLRKHERDRRGAVTTRGREGTRPQGDRRPPPPRRDGDRRCRHAAARRLWADRPPAN